MEGTGIGADTDTFVLCGFAGIARGRGEGTQPVLERSRVKVTKPSLATLMILGIAAAGPISGCASGAPDPRFAPPELPATRDHGESWMTPDRNEKKKALLYVSDLTASDVYAFTYPGGKLVGKLTGFANPQGLCADKRGDLFVANVNGNDILEYKHGGTAPIATLEDPGYYPFSCAVDPTTGKLAVTNQITSTDNSGSVAIYDLADGKRKLYAGASLYYYEFCAYDGSGNLYVDGGTVGTPVFGFVELPKRKKLFTTITLNVAPSSPGGVGWDGKYVTVADNTPGANVVYRYAISGSSGTEKGSTALSGAQSVNQYALWPSSATRLIVPNVADNSPLVSNVLYYGYPAGGSPTKTIAGFGGEFAFGAAISR
jgi:hypothetical protein